MITFTPEVLTAIGTVGGGVVTGGYAVWKRLSKVLEEGRETKKGVDDLKNGVMDAKIKNAIAPMESDITELKENQKHVTSRIDALYIALVPHEQRKNEQ